MTADQRTAARLIGELLQAGRALGVTPAGRLGITPAAGLRESLIDQCRAYRAEIIRQLRREGYQADRGPTWPEWILQQPVESFYPPLAAGAVYRAHGWCPRCKRMTTSRRAATAGPWECESCPAAARPAA